MHNGSNTFKKILCEFCCGAGQRLDEDLRRCKQYTESGEGAFGGEAYDAGVWLLVTGVETLDADRHDGVERACEIDLIDKQ